MEKNEQIAKINYISLDALTGNVAGYMSFSEAAEKWNVTLSAMYAWRRRKKIQNWIKIGDHYYIPESSAKPLPLSKGRPRKVKEADR